MGIPHDFLDYYTLVNPNLQENPRQNTPQKDHFMARAKRLPVLLSSAESAFG